MNGDNNNLRISLTVACTVIGGCLVAVFMYAYVVRKEIVTVQVAVPTIMLSTHRPITPRPELRSCTANLSAYRRRAPLPSSFPIGCSEEMLGHNCAIEDGDCTLKAVEKNECGQALSLTRDTQKELVLPLIKNPLIKIWERTPDGLQIKRDESGKPTQVTTTLDEMKRLLGSDQLAYTPFIIMTSNQEIVALEEQYIP